MISYDKLKSYGIGINGCIGGFSHFVLWMETFKIQQPQVVADYYIQCVMRLGGWSEKFIADNSIENKQCCQHVTVSERKLHWHFCLGQLFYLWMQFRQSKHWNLVGNTKKTKHSGWICSNSTKSMATSLFYFLVKRLI